MKEKAWKKIHVLEQSQDLWVMSPTCCSQGYTVAVQGSPRKCPREEARCLCSRFPWPNYFAVSWDPLIISQVCDLGSGHTFPLRALVSSVYIFQYLILVECTNITQWLFHVMEKGLSRFQRYITELVSMCKFSADPQGLLCLASIT